MPYTLNIQEEMRRRAEKIKQYEIKIAEEQGVISLMNSLLQKGVKVISTLDEVKDVNQT